MPGLYKLDANHNPVIVGEDLDAINDWVKWHSNPDNRRVAETTIDDNHFVSTMFHGHTASPAMAPYLFETLVFGGPLSGESMRYRTWAEAEAGHAAAVERCKAAQGKTA